MQQIMKVTQILDVIAAANRLTPEQTQILEKGLRKLNANRSTDEVVEYLRQNDYPLVEDGDTLDEEIPAKEEASGKDSASFVDAIREALKPVDWNEEFAEFVALCPGKAKARVLEHGTLSALLGIAIDPTDEKGNLLSGEENEASLEIRLFRPGRP